MNELHGAYVNKKGHFLFGGVFNVIEDDTKYINTVVFFFETGLKSMVVKKELTLIVTVSRNCCISDSQSQRSDLRILSSNRVAA